MKSMDFVAIKVVYKKKAKGKFVPVYAIKTYRGSRNIAPLFLNSGSRRISVVYITPPMALPTGKLLVYVTVIDIRGLRLHLSITIKNLLTVFYMSFMYVCMYVSK